MVLTPGPPPDLPIRLVATDLDGTLLDERGRVSPRSRRALDALDALGVAVVFVTGRPMRWIDHLHEYVGGHGLAIVSNGGVVLDVRTETVVRHHAIDRSVGLEVADRLRAELPGTTFAVESLRGFAMEPDYPPLPVDRDDPAVILGPLERVYSDDVVKLLALDESAPAEEYWSRVDALVGDLVTTTWSAAGRPMAEISARGVTKGSVLREICAERGIAAAEVLAFGDMPNDLDVLAWAGTSYVMANAHPSLLSTGMRIAPANDEDGVARVLETVFGL